MSKEWPPVEDQYRAKDDEIFDFQLSVMPHQGEKRVLRFRASARTMLDELLNIDWRILEANMAHAVRDANGTAYNRTKYLAQRFEMIQTWANYLDKLAAGADVIPLPIKTA